VAAAVARAAVETGVARAPKDPEVVLRETYLRVNGVPMD